MSFRIGLISDIHASAAPLNEALDIFQQHSVDMIICAGDVAGYGEDQLDEVIELLQLNNCIVIKGNHDEGDTVFTAEQGEYFSNLPYAVSLSLEGKKIFIVHAQPPDKRHGGIKLLDQSGSVIPAEVDGWKEKLKDFDYDVLIVGHTHQVFTETVLNTLVINPGSTLFNHSCMMLTLPEMKVTTYALGKEPVLNTWNWGMFYQS